MPKQQLYINNTDVYTQYGISMDNTALSALMTPNGKKSWITNEVRDENGVRYLAGTYVPKVAAREFTLNFNLTAPDEQTFFTRYAAFCNDILEGGIINIKTSFQPSVVYRCKYISCTQFTQFRREMAQFALKLVENNPSDRAL